LQLVENEEESHEIKDNSIYDFENRVLDLKIDQENLMLIMDLSFNEYIKSMNIMNIFFGYCFQNIK